MQQKELASLLDISPAMVSRLAKRGMPTDTLERAERWRKRHLEPGRVKGLRLGTVRAIAHQTARPTNSTTGPISLAMHHAQTMMQLADELLASGQSIDVLVPALRTGLAAVPVAERGKYAFLSWQVMDVLTAEVFALLPKDENPMTNDDHRIYSDSLGDDEAAFMSDFWYRVAAGEVRPT